MLQASILRREVASVRFNTGAFRRLYVQTVAGSLMVKARNPMEIDKDIMQLEVLGDDKADNILVQR